MSNEPSQQAPNGDSNAEDKKTKSKNIKGAQTKQEVGKRNISGTFGTLLIIIAFCLHSWTFWAFIIPSLVCLAFCLFLELKHLGYTKARARNWALIFFATGLLGALAYCFGSESNFPNSTESKPVEYTLLHSTNLEPQIAVDILAEKLQQTSDQLTQEQAKEKARAPRKINRTQWERFIEILGDDDATKTEVKVVVGSTNSETMNFAVGFRKMLNDAGYGNPNEPVEIATNDPKPPDDQNTNEVIAVVKDLYHFNNPNNLDYHGNNSPILHGNGVLGIDSTTKDVPYSVLQFTNDPNGIMFSYYRTTNQNLIFRSIVKILNETIGISAGAMQNNGILKPDEVGFYIPPQVQ